MKKYILLIILVFLCFGCKAEYTIKINKDKSVEETVTALENEDYYARYPKSSKKRVIRFTATFVNNYLESLNYNRKIVVKNEYTGEQVQHKFKNLKEYFEKSKAHEQLYKTYDTSIDGKLVTISLKDKYPKNGNSVDKYIINDCKVTIILPFLVKNHNADEVDKSKNSYTWDLNIDEAKDIYIQFDTSKKVIKDDLSDYLTYIIIGSVLIVLLIIYASIMSKKNKRNKI